MDRLKELGQDILNPIFTAAPIVEDLDILALSKETAKVKKVVVSMIKPGVNRRITMEEVKAHNGEKEPWFIVNGEVYDGTGFLSLHPGGAESITIVAGENASEDFMAIHSAVSTLPSQEYRDTGTDIHFLSFRTLNSSSKNSTLVPSSLRPKLP